MREEDIPKTPAQKAAEEKAHLAEARVAAKKRLGLKVGKRKGKGRKLEAEM